MSGQWLHGAEDSPSGSERRSDLNAARAEAVLDFARHVGPLGDSVKVDTERMARWFIQQQGWSLPAAERTQP